MSSVTVVNTSALHIMKIAKAPYKEAVMSSIITSNDLVSTLMRSTLGGIVNKMKRVYKYAKDDYTLALPTGTNVRLNVPTKEELAIIIADTISYPLGVLVIDFKSIEYKPYFEVLDYLMTERKLEPLTETIHSYLNLSLSNGQKIYMTNSIVSPDGLSVILSYEYWEFVLQRYTYNGRDWIDIPVLTKTHEYTDVIERPAPISNANTGKRLIVLYSKLNNLGEVLSGNNYWIYDVETNIYPELNDTLTTIATDEYFPVVPVRYNNQDLTGQDAIILQAQLDELAISIPAKQVAYDAAFAIDQGMWIETEGAAIEPPSWALKQELATLQKQKDNAETGIANAAAIKETDLYKTSKELLKIIDIPFLKLGEQLNANPDIAEIDHAYVMFGADLQSNEKETIAYLNHYFNYIRTLGVNDYFMNPSQTTTGSLTEHGLRIAMSFLAIKIEYMPGKIDKGQLGDARKFIDKRPYGAEYPVSYIWFDLQVTHNMIRRVIVENLSLTNYVNGNYKVTTTSDDVKANPDNHNLIIPLEYNLTLMMPPVQRNRLYTDCALLVVNCTKTEKLKWYQEKWFAFVIQIVGMVLMVYSGQLWIDGLVKAAIAEYLVTYLLISAITFVALKFTMDFVVREYGTKIGIVAAIVLATAAMILSQGQYGIQLFEKYTLYYAQLALQSAQALLSSTNEFIKITVEKVIEEYTTYTKLLKDAYDAMDTNEALKTLDMRADFNPLLFTVPKRYYSVAGETPKEFYDRTLNLADNTTYGIHKAIPNFARNLLVLDKNTVTLSY